MNIVSKTPPSFNRTTEGKVVEEAFKSHQIITSDILEGGFSKRTTLVNLLDHAGNKKPFVFCTSSSENDTAKFNKAVAASILFSKNDIPVAKVLKHRTSFKNSDYIFYIQEFINGAVMYDLSPDMLQELGKYVGKINAIPFADEMKEALIPNRLPSRSLCYGDIDKLKLPMGYSHGDIAPNNILFNENDASLAAIIDLDEVEYGFPIRDVIKALYYFCYNETNQSIDTEKTKRFFSGYLSEYKMTMKEARLIPALLSQFADELPNRYIQKSKDTHFFENIESYFLKHIPARSENIITTLKNIPLVKILGQKNLMAMKETSENKSLER